MQAAAEIDPDSDYGEYDLAPGGAKIQPAPPLGEPGLTEAAPIAPVTSVLSYQSPGTRAELDTEKLTKQTVPLWILSGGLIVEGFLAMLRGREDPTLAVMHLLFGVGVGSVLMMGGVLIAARVRGIKIGSLGSRITSPAATRYRVRNRRGWRSPVMPIALFHSTRVA